MFLWLRQRALISQDWVGLEVEGLDEAGHHLWVEGTSGFSGGGGKQRLMLGFDIPVLSFTDYCSF